MFSRLGQLTARRAGTVILIWLAILVGAALWGFLSKPAPALRNEAILPPDSPYSQAVDLVQKAFPRLAARSRVVVVGYRAGGLTDSDIKWLSMAAKKAAEAAQEATGEEIADRVLPPDLPWLRPRLVSPDGEAAMALISLPTNLVSPVTVRAVNVIQKTLDQMETPEGVKVGLTDSAVIGRDFALKTQQALDRTTIVTVVAILVILVLVYRSPFGAIVPLVSIGSSVFLAFIVLAVLAKAGWEVSDMERIFAVVLIFGAGVDYALFWISRYRESLRLGLDFDSSAISATRFAGPAILAGAATTICGLSTLIFTRLGPTHNTGKVLAIVLIIALLAALTLAPALSRMFRRMLFWPVGVAGGTSIGDRVFWPRLSAIVSRRPGLCLLAGISLLGAPALYALHFPVRFDSLTKLPPNSVSERGFALMSHHFDTAELYSSSLVIEFGRPVGLPEMQRLSQSIADRIFEIPGVDDVYSLNAPLGRKQRATQNALVRELLPLMAGKFYVSETKRVMRMEVLVNDPPFSPQAMDIIQRAMAIARQEADHLTSRYGPVRVLATGLTPYVLSIRTVVSSDQRRVMLLATVVIGLIVLLLIRRVWLTVFMLLATWLTYGATITFASLFFEHYMDLTGLDWKVRLIVFVIVVAVGQDYNVFLAARLFEELSRSGKTEAARRAILSTGAVISNCGLIMAATLGSLWAGRLLLLQQIGFSLALGVLIDTFFVRPVLIPSFFLLVERGRGAGPPGTALAPSEQKKEANTTSADAVTSHADS